MGLLLSDCRNCRTLAFFVGTVGLSARNANKKALLRAMESKETMVKEYKKKEAQEKVEKAELERCVKAMGNTIVTKCERLSDCRTLLDTVGLSATVPPSDSTGHYI